MADQEPPIDPSTVPPVDSKKLPKGYAYEPVKEKAPETPTTPGEERSGRRARPRVNYAEIASPKPVRIDTAPPSTPSSRKRASPGSKLKSSTKIASAPAPMEEMTQALQTIQSQLNSLEATQPPKKKARTAPRTPRNVRPAGNAKSSAPVSVMKQCSRILKKLMAHRHAWPFNTPVDPLALGIPDYFAVISQPMDFGTIAHQLEHSHYTDPEEFHDDVRLVFENCRRYNAAGSDIVVMANILESEIFELEWGKFPKWQADQASKAQNFDLQQKISELTHTMLAVQQQMKTLTQSQLYPLSPPAAASSPRARAAPQPAPQKRRTPQPMTFEEKRWLSEQIGTLDTEPLIHVVKIIHEAHPLVQNSEAAAPDVIEIDIDSLDIAALRKLMTFVKKTTGFAPPSRRGKSSRPSFNHEEPAPPPSTESPRQPSSPPSTSPAPVPHQLSDDIDIGVAPVFPANQDNSSSSDTDSATTESDEDEPKDFN